MNKKELSDKLNKLYMDIESALTDESVMTVGKRITNLNDDLGGIVQEIEDDGIELDENDVDKE